MKNQLSTKKKPGAGWRNFKKNWLFYALAAPGVIFLAMFCYAPMAGLYIVFEHYTFDGGLFGSEFVGLKNFEFFFKNMDNAIRATKNTIIINFGSILLGIVINVIIAMALNEIRKKPYRSVTQAVMLFPHFMSWIVIGTISLAFFDSKSGIINQLLTTFGFSGVNFYMKADPWWAILILLNVWKGVGYGSLIYYGSIVGFDSELYEAARIDGAGRLKQAFYITLPLLKPTIIIMFLLSVGGILMGSVDQIMGMTQLNPLLLKKTDTIATFVYRSAIANSQFESASAITLYQSVFGFITVMLANFIVKKIEPDYSLF